MPVRGDHAIVLGGSVAGLPTAIIYLIFQRRVAQGVAITAGIK